MDLLLLDERSDRLLAIADRLELRQNRVARPDLVGPVLEALDGPKERLAAAPGRSRGRTGDEGEGEDLVRDRERRDAGGIAVAQPRVIHVLDLVLGPAGRPGLVETRRVSFLGLLEQLNCEGRASASRVKARHEAEQDALSTCA